MTFGELKKRLVFKVAVGYLALTWLIIQVIGTLTPILDLPYILVRGLAFMLIMGYPLIMLMAWAYELTHQANWDKRAGAGGTGNGYYGAVIGIVVLTLTIMLVDIFVLRR